MERMIPSAPPQLVRGRRALMGARRLCFPAKEALPAVDWAALGWTEGNGCFAAALRARSSCLGSRRSGRRTSLPF